MLEKIENIKHKLALTLFTARKCSGINHQELVEISGVTRPILSGIENAHLNPTLDTLVKLSDSLNIDLELLFLSKNKFEKLKYLMNHEFELAKLNNFEILISDSQVKKLLRLSQIKNKKNYGRAISLIRRVIEYNFPELSETLRVKMTFNAAIGYVYQQDGFRSYMEFGIWLAREYAD